MILWTDFVGMALLVSVLLVFRLLARKNPLPRELGRFVRGLEVFVVLLLAAMVLLFRGQ